MVAELWVGDHRLSVLCGLSGIEDILGADIHAVATSRALLIINDWGHN